MAIPQINLDKQSSVPLYLQLFQQLKVFALDGKLQGNEKLPTIRAFAQELGVNTVTIVNAYRCLEEEGLIYKKVGSGSFVTPKGESRSQIDFTAMEEADRLPLQIGDAAYNFASGTPTTDLFPVQRFKEVLNEVLDRDMGEAFGYHDPQGYYPLRKAICSALAAQKMNLVPDHLQIISGAQQGIDLVAKALLKYGDTVLIEAPTYTGALASFRSRGVRVESVPLTPMGVDLNQVESVLRKYRPKLMYVMPNFHNPTGWTYPEQVKIELIELCNRYRVYLLEDDYASELYFGSGQLKTLKALDTKDQVIYLKSFSKIMMPGLRLGIMTLPEHLSASVLSAKQSTDVSTFGLTQRAFELFIKKGYWKEQVESVCSVFKQRYETFKDQAEKIIKLPLECHYPDGGIHFWIKVPEAVADSLYREAAQRGVLTVQGDLFFQHNTPEKYLRMSTASLSPEEIHQGMELFAQAVAVVLGQKTTVGKRGRYTPIL